MQDIWTALEEHTRAWRDLDRQGLADAVWSVYVAARFSHTGDVRALQFLYPYLNRGARDIRLSAIEVTAQVFQGAGPAAIAHLDYFTQNMDPFLKDRAVQMIGAAVAGWGPKIVLEHLSGYLNHRNQFIQRQAITALSRATFGTGAPAVLTEIQRLAPACRLSQQEFDLAVARVFAGRPTEEAYALVADPAADQSWRGTDLAVGILLRGAAEDWYQRGCRDFFEPRLYRTRQPNDPAFPRWHQFTHRAAVEGLSRAACGKGLEPLRRMLHLRENPCTLHALLVHAPQCFAGADVAPNRGPLLDLLRHGDVQQQCIAAACLSVLLAGTEDAEVIADLRTLCDAKNRSVAARAIAALGSVARSTCDRDLRTLCLKLSGDFETAAAAMEAFGLIFQGSGRGDILADIRERAEAYRHQRVPGKKHFRPLTMCFHSVGLVYQGTGSMEPVDFLLDALNLRRTRWCPYRWAAGRALVMIEFPASTIARALDQPWI